MTNESATLRETAIGRFEGGIERRGAKGCSYTIWSLAGGIQIPFIEGRKVVHALQGVSPSRLIQRGRISRGRPIGVVPREPQQTKPGSLYAQAATSARPILCRAPRGRCEASPTSRKPSRVSGLTARTEQCAVYGLRSCLERRRAPARIRSLSWLCSRCARSGRGGLHNLPPRQRDVASRGLTTSAKYPFLAPELEHSLRRGGLQSENCIPLIVQGPHAHVQGASLKAWGRDLGRVFKPWAAGRLNTALRLITHSRGAIHGSLSIPKRGRLSARPACSRPQCDTRVSLAAPMRGPTKDSGFRANPHQIGQPSVCARLTTRRRPRAVRMGGVR